MPEIPGILLHRLLFPNEPLIVNAPLLGLGTNVIRPSADIV